MATPGSTASTDDVVTWLLGTGFYDLQDASGRPLGEQAAKSYAVTSQNEQFRCFGDERDAAKLPCNVAALGQLQGAWHTLNSALSCFDSARPPSYGRMFRRAEAAGALAPMLALRAPGQPVSEGCAALYKVTVGFSELLCAVLIDGRADADEEPEDDALTGFLSSGPWLVGDRQVCAGSVKQIQTVWRALCEDQPFRVELDGWDAPWFSAALDARQELAALAAAAAGAARVVAAAGRSEQCTRETHVCWRLYAANTVPRQAEALRQHPDAGPMHPALLYGADDVPACLHRFVDSLTPEASLADIDAALELHARPCAERLMDALGRSGAALSLDAFRSACRG